MTKPGANPGHLVRRHRCADAAAAYQHASLGCAIKNSPAHGFGKIRIIHRLLAVGSLIDDLMAALAQVISDKLLHLKTRVVSSNDDAHINHLKVEVRNRSSTLNVEHSQVTASALSICDSELRFGRSNNILDGETEFFLQLPKRR